MKDIGSLNQVDTGPSSPLFKAAITIYDLTRKKKNGNLGKERFVERELETLKSYEVKLEEKQGKLDGSESEKEENTADEVKKKVERGKRKSFDELKSSKMKKARVDNIIQVIKADVGLDKHIVEQLKMEEKMDKEKEKEKEAFKAF